MKPKKMKIVLLGPQGGGKGTQGEFLSQKLGLPRICTGDIYRQEIQKGTDLGKLIASYIDSGRMMPNELTNETMSNRIKEDDCQNGFILDGYPRNLNQTESLGRTDAPNMAILINISDQEAMKRLSGRLACRCGMNYHSEYNPPQKEGVCDKCGGQLYKRKDDNKEAIKVRLDIYHRDTEPLINYYKDKGILMEINGEQSILKVQEDILSYRNFKKSSCLPSVDLPQGDKRRFFD